MVLFCRISKAHKNENNLWYVLMLLFAMAFLVASIIGTVLLYYFFIQVCYKHE